MPQVVHTVAETRAAIERMRVALPGGRHQGEDRSGSAGRVALVPTMGALHSGHLALAAAAREIADIVVVSIFVNPLQFGATEDLSTYPRTLDDDVLALQDRADIVFAPSAVEMYPAGDSETRVSGGRVAKMYEGASRPTHFDGVLTVVAKLLGIVGPDAIFFGEKDAQQLFLVRQMVTDLNIPTEVTAVPTVREGDGLALSSRNRYLDDSQRVTALVLSHALSAVAQSTADGVEAALRAGTRAVQSEPSTQLDYLALADPTTFLAVPADFHGDARALIAVRVGSTRLIDNRMVTFP